ncbi:MAG: type II toxin-antitoxin system PemK/MazF family toxin [Candidatus Kapaibacterium sp.]
MKPRPALVLTFDADHDVLLARITSKSYSEPGDISLVNWKELGLMFPSTLRLSKLVTLKSERVRRLIGHLTKEDRQKVLNGLHDFVSSLEKDKR